MPQKDAAPLTRRKLTFGPPVVFSSSPGLPKQGCFSFCRAASAMFARISFLLVFGFMNMLFLKVSFCGDDWQR